MLVTKPAPQFTASAIMGDNSFQEISLADYKGKKVVLFFYPLDFTFVCPTEILAFNHRLAEFEKRGVQVLGCSVDSQFSHWAWKNTDTKAGGIGDIQYPIISDLDKNIARKYDVLVGSTPATVLTDDVEEETTVGGDVALRASFLIDEDGIIRHAVINDLPLGRSVEETLRVLDALQFTEEHGEVCPANWHKGDEAMKPTAEGVAEYLAKHAND
jgi:peroxiredoxin (alkyl hydroperoxide reductase subunit C)